METVAFPPKFKQANLQSFDGRGSPGQSICHFRGIAGNDALMIRLFVSTLRETAFDWYARLPAGTINSWADEVRNLSLRILSMRTRNPPLPCCVPLSKRTMIQSIPLLKDGERWQ